jgi:hypothetical protein
VRGGGVLRSFRVRLPSGQAYWTVLDAELLNAQRPQRRGLPSNPISGGCPPSAEKVLAEAEVGRVSASW